MWAEPDGTSRDQSCSSDSHTGRETCVSVVGNLQEDRFQIHTSILRSSKLTLLSANQGPRRRQRGGATAAVSPQEKKTSRELEVFLCC